MTRITNAIRERIISLAIDAAFKRREADLKTEEQSLGMEAYETVVPEAGRKAAANMPDGWIQMDSCLRFNANGWTARLCVDPAVPVPCNRGHCMALGSLVGELADRVQTHLTSSRKLTEDRYSAKSELAGFLEQFKTLKQMRDVWPEGEPFYAEFDLARGDFGVPSVRTAEINKLLNLTEAA